MSKIIFEYQGFLKFVTRASKEVVSWFGPHCNYDAAKIMLMSAREWDAMSDEERRYFIRADFLNSRQNERRPPKGNNSFLSFMLQRRYATVATNNTNPDQQQSSFDPRAANAISQMYKELPQEERDKYSSKTLADISMDHVIEKRSILHELYDPKELNFLEYIIKTSPKPPRNSRIWYSTLKNLSLINEGTKALWNDMRPGHKRFYQDCAALDQKRHKFERSAWITKLLSLNYDDDEDITLSDFESERAKSNLEALRSIIDLNKELPGAQIQTKPPKCNSFTLFMKDVGANSGFELGKFRTFAKCWSNLSEEERMAYAEKSKEMKSSYQRQIADSSNDLFDICSLSDPLFRHSKSMESPTKPSHLVSFRMENVEDYYGRLNKIPRKDRKLAWDALSEQDKDNQLEGYKLKIKVEGDEVDRIRLKFDFIEGMIEKAMKLEQLKRQLKLVRNRRSNIKNMYPQINRRAL